MCSNYDHHIIRLQYYCYCYCCCSCVYTNAEHGPGVSREAVAAERIRLEKERRVMSDSDDELFYDLDDTTAVYEFDLRHRGPLKRGGVVRQVSQLLLVLLAILLS
jgi:hypothetical protein